MANNSWQNGDDTFIYQYGLWPDEPAWKIKFEFSQQSDFSPTNNGRCRTFRCCRAASRIYELRHAGSQPIPPLPRTNLTAFIENFSGETIHGQPPNAQPQGGLRFSDPAPPDGMRLTLVSRRMQTNDSELGLRHMRNNNVSTFRYACGTSAV